MDLEDDMCDGSDNEKKHLKITETLDLRVSEKNSASSYIVYIVYY